MVLAGNRVIENGGGLAIALEGKVLADLPLPIGGLMADEPVEVVDEKAGAYEEAFCRAGHFRRY